MKQFLILTLFMILSTSTASAQTFTVEKVMAGDLIKLTNGETLKLIGVDAPPIVFPKGIDPTLYDPSWEMLQEAQKWEQSLTEVSQMGQEAAEFLGQLIETGQEIRVELDVQERDEQGRLLGYVYLKGLPPDANAAIRPAPGHYYVTTESEKFSKFINATVISSGYATVSTPPNTKHADLFHTLYEEARNEGRGFWKK